MSKTTALQSIVRGEGQRVGVQEARGKSAEGGSSKRVASGKRAVPRIITPSVSNNSLWRAFAAMPICKVARFFVRFSSQVLEMSLITT